MLILSNVNRGHLRSFCRSGRQCLFEWMIHQLRSSHTPQAALCISTQTATTYGMGEEGKVYEPSRGMAMRDALQRLRHPARRRGQDLQEVPRPRPGLPLLGQTHLTPEARQAQGRRRGGTSTATAWSRTTTSTPPRERAGRQSTTYWTS